MQYVMPRLTIAYSKNWSAFRDIDAAAVAIVVVVAAVAMVDAKATVRGEAKVILAGN